MRQDAVESSAADYEHRVPPVSDDADPNRLMEFMLRAAQRSKHVVLARNGNTDPDRRGKAVLQS